MQMRMKRRKVVAEMGWQETGRLIHLDYTVDLGHKPEAGEETNAA